MQTGIYRIVNLVNGKIYVGSAAREFAHRWRRHKHDLKKAIHANKKLQNAWNKYGEAAFNFEVIEIVEPASCVAREQYWMDLLKPEYNLSPTAGSCLGIKRSEECKTKQSQRQMGRPGPKHSDEIKARISQKKTGVKIGPFTDEHKAKISAAHKGKTVSKETRNKLSEINKLTMTNEQKRKIAEGRKRYWDKWRAKKAAS
jgi:group I intron endonuclease